MAQTSSGDGTVLDIAGLYKSYGSVQALAGLSFSVPRGAFYGFFGRNGAGKTTTLDIATGLLGRDRGHVTLLGESFGTEPSPAVKQRFGYVGGHIGLYQWLSLQEHLDFVAGFYDAWDPARCQELQQVFRLPMDRRVGELSPGMHVQFQLLMALSHHPELLILDEPGNLDPVVRTRLMATMIGILEDEDATIVMASHLIDEVEGICDHMCIIDQGTALVAGPVKELLEDAREIHLQGVRPEEMLKLVGSGQAIGHDGWKATLTGFTEERAAELARKTGAASYEVGRVSLQEYFIALTEGRD